MHYHNHTTYIFSLKIRTSKTKNQIIFSEMSNAFTE